MSIILGRRHRLLHVRAFLAKWNRGEQEICPVHHGSPLDTKRSPNQPNPIPKPIRDRSGQLEDTQGVFVVKGETSRSHEIDEKGLHEELGSSDRSGKPDKLSENIRVKQVHDGTGQPVEQNSSSVHTVKEHNLLLKKIVTLRHSTRTTSSTVQSTRRTLTSTFQECQIQQ